MAFGEFWNNGIQCRISEASGVENPLREAMTMVPLLFSLTLSCQGTCDKGVFVSVRSSEVRSLLGIINRPDNRKCLSFFSYQFTQEIWKLLTKVFWVSQPLVIVTLLKMDQAGKRCGHKMLRPFSWSSNLKLIWILVSCLEIASDLCSLVCLSQV